MKRPHRRMHVLMWLVLAPATLIAGVFAWMQRPQTPFSEIPDAIEIIDESAE